MRFNLVQLATTMSENTLKTVDVDDQDPTAATDGDVSQQISDCAQSLRSLARPSEVPEVPEVPEAPEVPEVPEAPEAAEIHPRLTIINGVYIYYKNDFYIVSKGGLAVAKQHVSEIAEQRGVPLQEVLGSKCAIDVMLDESRDYKVEELEHNQLLYASILWKCDPNAALPMNERTLEAFYKRRR